MTQDQPLVDVGVVTWNTRDLTVTALRRLLDTDQGARLRLLVHDNASADGTPDAVREQVPEADVEVCPDNLGFAAGVNRLIARSHAPWFLALNSDAWPAPGAIGALVAAAERHPRAAAVAPRLERPDGALEHSTHPFPSVPVALASAVGARGHWAERHALHGAWAHDRERSVDWAVGAALLIRREALEDVGGLDESFFMYVEDLEWCHRARRHGWEIWFTPEALVVHIGNASGEKRYGSTRTATWLANTYRFYRRHHGPFSTAAYRSANALGAVRGTVRATMRRDRGLARFWWRQVPLHFRPEGRRQQSRRG
ncbi:MAG TPA: glycosyltransferase family 2 protein [Mycobacteriales bacterium]|nr:glycosyltransferase family 2 protein [Mycobacteriales bacterium]